MAGTSRLFLRFTNEEEPSREQVLKIIAIKYEVPVLGIRKVNSGYNILFKRKSDTDKILKCAATEVLRRINLSVKIPPEINTTRKYHYSAGKLICLWVNTHQRKLRMNYSINNHGSR